jgi:CelD/BcsL family acetyltransferase involved in cellulose biosynthesis
VAAFQLLLADWRALWTKAPDPEPFSHPGWVLAYVDAFEPSADLGVLAVRLAGTLVAVLPLIREFTLFDGMPVRRLRTPFNPHSFRVHVLTAAGPLLQIPCAVCNHLASMPGWTLLTIPRFAREGLADQLGHCLGCHGFPTVLHPHCPTRYVAIPDGAATGTGEEPWLAQVDRELKKKLKRASRQIAEDYRAEPVLETIEGAVPAALNRFYDIEASGWKGREGTAIRCAPETLRFYSEAARAFADDGALLLHFLRLEGITLAGAFSIVAGRRLFVLKWSYDEAYAKYRPGQLLSREMLRDCSARGIRAMDLGEDAPYKREWTPLTQEHEYLFVFNRTVYGKVLYRYRQRIRPIVGRMRRRWRRMRGAPELTDD